MVSSSKVWPLQYHLRKKGSTITSYPRLRLTEASNEAHTELYCVQSITHTKNTGVLSSADQGGLGVRSIEKVNKAFLGKWLWKVEEPGHGLWKQTLLNKYKLGNEGW